MDLVYAHLPELCSVRREHFMLVIVCVMVALIAEYAHHGSSEQEDRKLTKPQSCP